MYSNLYREFLVRHTLYDSYQNSDNFFKVIAAIFLFGPPAFLVLPSSKKFLTYFD